MTGPDPIAQDLIMEQKKDIAIQFLKMAASGQVDEAYRKFVSPEFKHHNPHFEGTAAALKAGMKQNAIQFPKKAIQTPLPENSPNQNGFL